MATYIIQPGRVLQRYTISPEGGDSGDASIPITAINANLTCTVATTLPFIGVLDEDSHLWRLQNMDVKYNSSNVTLNLSDIFRTRKMIVTEAAINVPEQEGGSTTIAFPRCVEADSPYGYAWKTQGVTLYTATQSPAPNDRFYLDANMTVDGGPVVTLTSPVVSPAVIAYVSGSWVALVAASGGGGGGGSDTDLDCTVVSAPV